MPELEIPFDVAVAYLSLVNLNAKETLGSIEEYIYEGKTYKPGFISSVIMRSDTVTGRMSA